MKQTYFSWRVPISLLIFCSLAYDWTNAQSWYDPDWQYRNAVVITNPTAQPLTDFQVQVNLDSSFDFSKPKTDGSDIRFTDADGTTLIPFWIELWDEGFLMATIWSKIPSIPVSGVTVYMYYGNPDATLPDPVLVETPPIGPFTRAVANPVTPIGDPGSGASLLAENIVYDEVSGHYWMVFANYRGGSPGVGLVWSDTPADAASWHWFGNVFTHTSGGSFAPHILKENGLWYIFFARWPDIVYITSPTIDGTYSSPVVVLSPTLTWEAYRVDEPYVFKRNDGTWIMVYMADAGGVTEQVGYAYASEITGPYTKFPGNPCIPFGPSGSYDAGTVADPWVYEYYGVYYIGYTVSSTKNSPWQTALATTTDWQTFTKQGVIFPLAPSGWDAVNSFRGALTRIGDTYVLSYTGDGYRMGIATQPVFTLSANIINSGEAVFNFFDDFEGTGIDLAKWTFTNGIQSQAVLDNGLLTLTATSDANYIRLTGTSGFGYGYIGETRGRHPYQGTLNKISEVGFADATWNTIRIVDDNPSLSKWQRQARITGGSDVYIDMAQNADQNWHTFHLFRSEGNIAGFQIDDNPIETTSSNVPSNNLPPFLMSYGTGNQFMVDWTRVRKWIGTDPETYVVTEGGPLTLIETHTPILCNGGTSGVTIIALGGTPPYTGTGTFTQTAGTVMYTVTDAVGGSANITVSLTEPDPLIASSDASEILCFGESSTVTISATGGIPPYSGTGIFTHTAGTFIHAVTDANGCTDEVTMTITEPMLLVASATYTPIPYPGGTSTVTVSASGGTPPYTGTGNFSQSAGIMVYSVTDGNGCIAQVTVTVTAPSTWYHLKWKYRREIEVSNPGSTTLTDFQVLITLDNSFDFTKAKNDGSDIRITDADKTTLLPYWIETWNTIDQSAEIWVKVPEIPVQGTTLYLYYGNPDAVISPPEPVETPPTGPFTRAVGNPINPIGDPGAGASLLAENIVYDDVTGHYWMVFANYRSDSRGVGLVWSDTPTDASSWHWYGNVYNHSGAGGSFAPHIIKENGLWYIFFAKWPDITFITCETINGTYSSPAVVLSPSESWETYRVDEPYVFERNDGTWIMMYMGDYGSAHEQIGYAFSANITGPYTKFFGNPCLPFGLPGSYDAGTVADPWVYEFHGTYYIGYTVSPTTSSPWQTAVATTTDWMSFTKLGIIFPLAGSGWDASNSFRGAITRIDSSYVFSYVGDSYRMGIATQPVYQSPINILNNGEAVFDFFDGFDGTEFDLNKWAFTHGSSGQASVANGQLTLTSPSESGYAKITGQKSFGMNYIGETRGYHPNQGTLNLIAEAGFADATWNTVRIVDDFLLGTTYWQRQAKLAGQPDVYTNMAQTADQNWHVFHISRLSPNSAGFQIDKNASENVSTNVPTVNLPPFLMSYGTNNNFIVDWTRVRKWIGTDPSIIIGEEEYMEILNLSVFLEGPFNGTDMNTDLYNLNLLPLNQPYNSSPWNYPGEESVNTIPNTDVVDWLLVEIRDATDGSSATSSTRVAQQAAFLLKDGSIVGLDGNSMLMFKCPVIHQVFVVIWHRNHLGILSANPLGQDTDGIYNYNFILAATTSYGNGQNELDAGTYGMISGDANADGLIDEQGDKSIWTLQSGNSGYFKSDINLDGQSDNQDKNNLWFINLGAETQIPE